MNIRSIASKIHQLQQVITLENCDICAVTETWIKGWSEDEEFVMKSIPPEGYKIFSHPRSDGRIGGGTALIYKSNINIEEKSVTTRDLLTMEYHDYKVHFKSLTLNLYVIYRFPNTSILMFCTELATILERNILDTTRKLVLLGDFNIHIDVVDDSDTITFNDFLDSFNLENLVHLPTHKCRHTLDLLITDKNLDLGIVPSQGHMIADHNVVHARIQIQNEIEKTETITYRKIKNINEEKFANHLETAVTKIQHLNSLADKVERYNTELKGVLDKHAPVKTKTVKITHQNPWFNDKIKEEIRLRRKKERAWNKDPTFYNFQAFYYQRRYVANLTKVTRSEYFKSQIVRTLWRL